MSEAFNWKSAWESVDDHELRDVKQYRLPARDDTWMPTLYPKDKFWDTEKMCLITVESVKTKVYKGVVGPVGEEGADFVHYSTDLADVLLEGGRFVDADKHTSTFVDVDEFADRVAEGTYQPHSNNGPPSLP